MYLTVREVAILCATLVLLAIAGVTIAKRQPQLIVPAFQRPVCQLPQSHVVWPVRIWQDI